MHRTTIDTNYHGTRHVCSRFMPLLRDNGTIILSARVPTHTHTQAEQQLTWGLACAAGRVVNVTARMASLSKLTVPTLKAAFAKPDLTLVRCLASPVHDHYICENRAHSRDRRTTGGTRCVDGKVRRRCGPGAIQGGGLARRPRLPHRPVLGVQDWCVPRCMCDARPLSRDTTDSRAHAGTNALTRVLARMEANNPNRYSSLFRPACNLVRSFTLGSPLSAAGRSGVLVNACCPGFCRTDLAGPKAPRSRALSLFLLSPPNNSLCTDTSRSVLFVLFE
jgi:NAD(P)-dependent dehydrogenase (short-subunit alcohol dehydrogenase family)